MVKHKKEIGTQGDSVNLEELNDAHAAAQKKPKRRNASVDSDGFSRVNRWVPRK